MDVARLQGFTTEEEKTIRSYTEHVWHVASRITLANEEPIVAPRLALKGSRRLMGAWHRSAALDRGRKLRVAIAQARTSAY